MALSTRSHTWVCSNRNNLLFMLHSLFSFLVPSNWPLLDGIGGISACDDLFIYIYAKSDDVPGTSKDLMAISGFGRNTDFEEWMVRNLAALKRPLFEQPICVMQLGCWQAFPLSHITSLCESWHRTFFSRKCGHSTLTLSSNRMT